jgi:protein TonB
MRNVSIFEKKWIDLVFEGRNKKYGAYQLRKDSDKTTLKALFSAVIFLSAIVSVFIIFNRLTAKNIPNITENLDTIIELTAVSFKKELPIEESQTAHIPLKKLNSISSLNNATIVPKTEIKPEINHSNTALVATSSNTAGVGSGINLGNNSGTTLGISIPTTNEPLVPGVLDKQPEFPGGIEKFYQFVGNRFEKPEMESAQPIRIIVYFVIEKNGTLTDIKILQNPGYGLDKEAIRVLKLLKTKWEPGIKNGNPVRTSFTLPIIIRPE